jgi:hypothetical protein
MHHIMYLVALNGKWAILRMGSCFFNSPLIEHLRRLVATPVLYQELTRCQLLDLFTDDIAHFAR